MPSFDAMNPRSRQAPSSRRIRLQCFPQVHPYKMTTRCVQAASHRSRATAHRTANRLLVYSLPICPVTSWHVASSYRFLARRRCVSLHKDSWPRRRIAHLPCCPSIHRLTSGHMLPELGPATQQRRVSCHHPARFLQPSTSHAPAPAPD
jgi:hypothetical protein